MVVAGESRDDEPFEVDTILQIHGKTRELNTRSSAIVPRPVHSAPRDPGEPNWDELI